MFKASRGRKGPRSTGTAGVKGSCSSYDQPMIDAIVAALNAYQRQSAQSNDAHAPVALAEPHPAGQGGCGMVA